MHQVEGLKFKVQKFQRYDFINVDLKRRIMSILLFMCYFISYITTLLMEEK